jgi:ATP-binding cassette subfamily F protein 3
VFKRIGDLSGGERARVSLAKLMLSDANFLILDEPTNHLDIASREILENAVSAYSGTVLYVSHDRYFINRTATRILELSENGLAGYDGNYDYYLEKKDTPSFSSSSGVSVSEQTAGKESVSSAKLDYHQQKQEQARKRKLENQIKKTEARIEEIDTRLAEIDELLTQEEIYTDPEKLLPLTKEREALDEEQLSLMQTWEDLQMQQEEDS